MENQAGVNIIRNLEIIKTLVAEKSKVNHILGQTIVVMLIRLQTVQKTTCIIMVIRNLKLPIAKEEKKMLY